MRKFLIALSLVVVCFFVVQCASQADKQEPAAASQSQQRQSSSDTKDGIYIGMVTFGPNAEDITGGSPVFLDKDGLATLNDLIDSQYQIDDNIGTALFYAAHMGLANMKKAEPDLPGYLHSVKMITFTDGLDVSSTGLSLKPISDPGNVGNLVFAGEDTKLYQNFIKMEIDTRRINGTNIDAYIVAVKGDDVTNMLSFEETRRSLSSSGLQYGGSRDIGMDELQAVFANIARNIVYDWTETAFTMITPEYARGTRVRMTFGGENNATQAQNARSYLEGEVTIRDREYYFTNIRYGGNIYSDAGQEVKGKIENGRVTYEFPLFSGYDFTKELAVRERELRMWQMGSRENDWQINSEYKLGSEADHVVKKYNALIYLILDKSSSISEEDVPKVRDAVKSFIGMLYDAYNQ